MKCLKSFHTKGYGQLVVFDCIHWDRASRHRYHDGITGNKPLGKKAYDSYSERRNIMIRLLNVRKSFECGIFRSQRMRKNNAVKYNWRSGASGQWGNIYRLVGLEKKKRPNGFL